MKCKLFMSLNKKIFFVVGVVILGVVVIIFVYKMGKKDGKYFVWKVRNVFM